MAYLIDGNNLIGHTSSYNLKDPRSKYEIVSKLIIFQRTKKTKVILVFDGAPDPSLLDKKLQTERFSIIYPVEGESADDAIGKIILKQTDRRRFFVVSSDREVQNFARAKGAKSLSCNEFNKELKRELKEYKKLMEETKKVTSLSDLEVKHWLEIFKSKNV
jgi:predicted RNA-binding protein with PIN domain